MLFANIILIYTYFDRLNINLDLNNLPDPFLNQESDSKEQSGYKETVVKGSNSESSSTNKELFDDLADNKLQVSVPFIPQSGDVIQTQEKLEDFYKAYVKTLDIEDSVLSLIDKNMWERFHKYIIENWEKFQIDGNFSIPLQIRYVMCSYIIAFIPGEFAFVVPGFYTYLIPKKAYNIPILSDGLKNIKKFFKFCKKTSKDKLFITFYFGRENSLQQDLKFLKNFPAMISSNPLGLLSELFAFKIKAEGYNTSGN